MPSREYVELNELWVKLEAKAEALNEKVEGLEKQAEEQIIKLEKALDIALNENISLRKSLQVYQALDETLQAIMKKNLDILKASDSQIKENMENMGLELSPEQLEVTLKPTSKRTFQVDASKNYQGKILQMILIDLNLKEWVTTADISKCMGEHGWPRNTNNVRLDLINIVKDGLVIKEGTKYRLPKQVEFIQGENVD